MRIPIHVEVHKEIDWQIDGPKEILNLIYTAFFYEKYYKFGLSGFVFAYTINTFEMI